MRSVDSKVTRCLICGGWMIDFCQNCADRTDRRMIYERAVDSRVAELTAQITRLTEERDRARRIAVALEQENAEIGSECDCQAIIQAMHDKWTTMPAHQLAAVKILSALEQS